MNSFEELREKYPIFEYKSYDIDEDDGEIRVSYSFFINGLTEFCPRWTFKNPSDEKLSDNPTFREMIFSLGMVELVSYWKATCSPEVIVSAGYISEKQSEWWKKLYFNGLGEFFYTNRIDVDIDSFMRIVSEGEKIAGSGRKVDNDVKMISIGGGKDSIMSLEVLREYKDTNRCYIINPRGATLATSETAGYLEDRIISSERFLDRTIVDLNSRGFLNGHTPFSAIVAFSALICAYINDIGHIVLSNESSANESTVENSTVNHQYSKSYEFERDFISYEAEFIGSGISYFSLLRPLTELQIAEYFAKKTQYHGIFRSCNAGSKTDVWCCNCPKCLFVYLILSPFLDSGSLIKIFGENLLEKESLIPTMEKLTGIAPEKPFECVGSRAEVNLAIRLAIKKYKDSDKEIPLLFRHYSDALGDEVVLSEKKRLLGFYDTQNSLPEELDALLKREIEFDKRVTE